RCPTENAFGDNFPLESIKFKRSLKDLEVYLTALDNSIEFIQQFTELEQLRLLIQYSKPLEPVQIFCQHSLTDIRLTNWNDYSLSFLSSLSNVKRIEFITCSMASCIFNKSMKG